MRRICYLLCIICISLSLLACNKTPIPGATVQPAIQAQNTATSDPNNPDNTETVSPTALGGAPEDTFIAVGSTAPLTGLNGIEGKAVVAGLQTLIILGFHFDGKVKADIRLVKGTDYATAVYVFTQLDRAYDAETLQFTIPGHLAPGSADTIAVYDTESNQVLAAGIFQ
jgi:hypothetical protein